MRTTNKILAVIAAITAVFLLVGAVRGSEVWTLTLAAANCALCGWAGK